jgi:hypothetical protein
LDLTLVVDLGGENDRPIGLAAVAVALPMKHTLCPKSFKNVRWVLTPKIFERITAETVFTV